MACFNPLFGFCQPLSCGITAKQTTLPLSDEAKTELCDELGNDYSTLVITDGLRSEIVGVKCVDGEPVFERGQEDSIPTAFGCGAFLKQDWTPGTILDLLELAQKHKTEELTCDETHEVCGIVSDSLDVCFPEDSCVAHIELKKLDEVSWRSCNNMLTFSEKGVTVETVPSSVFLKDGVFEHATVTVKDGCIVEICEGTNIVNSSCGNCCD